MQGIRSELFYELTTPVYPGDYYNTVYLNPIDYSAILPYTTVKRTGGKVIPLLFYNYFQDKYDVTLGENSLVQPYYEFLTDALLAQCNRSSCFNLKVKDNATILPDSAFILEVKINKNITTAKMMDKNVVWFIPNEGGDVIFGYSKWEVNRPVSSLEISARLMQHGNCLWEKTYAVDQDLSYQRRGIEAPARAYQTCIDDMAECLSYTTKGIVENISQNIHLLMLREQAH